MKQARALAWSTLTGVVAVLGDLLWPGFSALLFLVGFIALVMATTRAVVQYVRHRDSARPRSPRLRRARRRRRPPEPPSRIPEIAYSCVICGRPLTNHQSQLARVGSTCIRTYGPRPRMIANPEHERWRSRVAALEAERAAEQARLNVEHERALEAHAHDMDQWGAELNSHAGHERKAGRAAARGRMATMGVWCVGAVLGLTVGVSLFA